MAIRETGTNSGSERVGFFTRAVSMAITGRTDWYGNNPIIITQLNWALAAQNVSTLYARLSVTDGVTAKNSAFQSLPNSGNATGTIGAQGFPLTDTPYNASNTSFTVTANIYTNATGTTRPNNTLESTTSGSDDTRMGRNSNTAGSYWASIFYSTVTIAPTNVSVASNGTSVSWSAPTDNGGKGVTNYYVYIVNPGSSNAYDQAFSTGSSSTTYTLPTAAAAGSKVKVTAINAVGESQYSTPYTVVASTYSVSYAGNGNTGGSVPTDSTAYLAGQTVTVLGNTGSLTRTGYTFGGWSGNSTTYSGGSTFTMPASAVTLTAIWTANTFTLSYNASNGSVSGTGTTSATIGTYPSTSLTVANNNFTPPANYTFNGWSTTSGGTLAYNGGASYTFDVSSTSSSAILYARWLLSTVTPVFTDSVLSSPATMNVTYSDGVLATNAVSYSISSGALPAGLSLNTSTGAVTGTPTVQGSYTFKVRATSSTATFVDTANITIVVGPPGKKPDTDTKLTTAKRFDGTSWVNLIIMKRFIGIGQPGADANGWINITN